jgi:hypothetical protein
MLVTPLSETFLKNPPLINLMVSTVNIEQVSVVYLIKRGTCRGDKEKSEAVHIFLGNISC